MNAGGTGSSETVYFEPTDTFTIAELTVRRSVICYIPPTRTFVRPRSRLLHAIFMLMRCNKGHRIRSPYIPPPPGCKIRKTAADFGYCRLNGERHIGGHVYDQGKRNVSQYARRALRSRLLPRQAYAARESPHGRCVQDLHRRQGHGRRSEPGTRNLCPNLSPLLCLRRWLPGVRRA